MTRPETETTEGVLAGTPIEGQPPWSASPEEVAKFVRRVGKPYDPTNDQYEDPGPFARDVKAGKSTVIYNAHSYHTKVPPQGIVPYLEHYTHPGDLVLDPFCGSGMTGVACLMTGRNAILNDLSPAATHIAYNYVTPIDAEEMRREVSEIKAAVVDEFDWLYGTICDRCGGPATIVYTIWSDVYVCKSCQHDIVLWDAAVVRERGHQGYDPPLSALARETPAWRPVTTREAPHKRGRGGAMVPRERGDVIERFQCPTCGTEARKTQLTLRRTEPVATNYECSRCRPARGEHRTSDAERTLITELASHECPYWTPNIPFGSDREMWRSGHGEAGIDSVADFWTPRNLRAAARLWQEVSRRKYAASLKFAFTACVLKTSRATRYNFGKRGNIIVAGTLYIPSFTVENNALWVFERKVADILAAWRELPPKPHAFVPIVTMHAGQNLPVEDAAVDYVFTDPPFGSNIFYSDVSLLWEAWLGYLTNQEFEAVWNRSNRTAQNCPDRQDAG